MTDWKPDGIGLNPESKQIIKEHGHSPIHLRLNQGDGYPRTACNTLDSLGAWWTGLQDEVTCVLCKEWKP